MDGGPSHVDTFDPKPMLTRHQGQKIGDKLNNTLYNDPNRVWLGSPGSSVGAVRVAVGQ
ncbi:MAG: hypothetical protein CM1200mP2_47970 [Planctomycetaceae bacterium]|nr:MAG: hypothetical protein CM1200mP2_47970 [Planctomycetaceae bacterium]